MHIAEPWTRLDRNHMWHYVDKEHNRIIARHLTGCREILDIGCGYGSLTHYLHAHGYQVTGVDPDAAAIDRAQRLFPETRAHYRHMSAEQLTMTSQSCDAVVLRDTLHHLCGEADFHRSCAEIERVLRPGGRLVVFDPEPNWIVRLCRRVARHEDFECSSRTAVRLLRERGWSISRAYHTEFCALPLSGGYVGRCLVPPLRVVWKTTLEANRYLGKLLNAAALGRHFLWRYIVVAHVP